MTFQRIGQNVYIIKIIIIIHITILETRTKKTKQMQKIKIRFNKIIIRLKQIRTQDIFI